MIGTADAQKQQLLSGGTIDGIIAGVICFCSLVVVIVAIVTQRRPCDKGWLLVNTHNIYNNYTLRDLEPSFQILSTPSTVIT